MPRSRLLVALIVPEPVGTEIDGLRRALGSRSVVRLPPHITLVPPINVNDERLDDAHAVLRTGAASLEPLTLELGPVGTFAPKNPAVFLEVASSADLVAVREAFLVEPLERRESRPFVPHVTIAENLHGAQIAQAVALLGAYRASVTIARVHLLAQQPDHRYEIVGDAPFGGPRVVGRGGLPVSLTVTETPPAPTFVVTARREGAVVGVASGRRDPAVVIDRLVVEEAVRGEGVGTLLLREVLALADGPASCVCPAGSPGESWLAAHGWHRGGDVVRMRWDG